MSASELKVLSLEEIEATLEFLNGKGPQTMKVNVDALARTAREYHRLREALEFYAERETWVRNFGVGKPGERVTFYPNKMTIADEDCGTKAREALKGGAE